MFAYVVSKFANIATGVAFGVLQIALVTRYCDKDQMGFLITALSIFTYFSFFDLGFSKPFYAKIRIKFCGADFRGAEFLGELAVPALLIPLGSVAMGVALLIYSSAMAASSVFGFSVLLSIAFGFNIGLNFYRPIFDAVDKFAEFERLEMCKRILLLLAQLSIPFDRSLALLSASMLLINVLLFFRALCAVFKIYHIADFPPVTSVRMAVGAMKREVRDATSFLVFTLAETGSNNMTVLVAPFILGGPAVVFLNLWFRLYRGVALISRAVIDIYMHGAIRHYIRNDKEGALRQLKLASGLSALLMIGVFVFIMLYKDLIVKQLSNSMVAFSAFDWGMMVFLVVLNIFQHTAGTFLLNVGTQFNFSRNTSLCILVLLGFLTYISSATKIDAQGLLSIFMLVYGTGAFIYVWRARAVLK